MTQRTGIFFDIISDYKDKGAKAAAKDLAGLDGLAKKVAKSFVGIFAVEKVAMFSKDAVNAFAAETKQAAIFGQTITGLGFAMQQSGIVEYINKMSESTGILKDELEPAFSSLLRYTRNVAQSQKLLSLALDISAGTGKSLQEVSNALGRASLGNYTALVRLGAGITTTDAKLRTFQGNLDYLSSAFNGDAQAAANSFGGTLARIKVQAHEATVEIGAGLAAGITSLANAFSSATGGMNIFKIAADSVFNLLHGITRGVVATKDAFLTLNPKYWLHPDELNKKKAQDLANVDKTFNNYKQQSLGISNQQFKVNTNLINQSNKLVSNAKTLTAQQQQQLALQKAQQVLTQAGKVLDVQQAEIIAAQANASLSQDELDRLKLKKALLDENATAAAQLAQQVINDQLALLNLPNPFGSMNTDIQAVIASLIEMQKQLLGVSTGLSGTTAAGTAYTNGTLLSSGAIVAKDLQGFGVLAPAPNAPTVNVVVSVDPMNGNINASTQNQSLQGTPTNISRVNALTGGYG